MTEGPDFRADKSDSVEGAGNAASRWDAYHLNLDEEVQFEAFPGSAPNIDEYPDLVRDEIAADAMEQFELIGGPTCSPRRRRA